MKFIKNLCLSIMFTITFCYSLYYILDCKFIGINTFIKDRELINSIWDFVLVGFFVFCDIFAISIGIFSLIKLVYHLVVAWASIFNLDKKLDKIIYLDVDDNNIIRNSFVELSDGKIIPIKINRIVTRNLDKEKEVEEKIHND